MHKVLLVDDEVFARKGLCNLINWEEEGYEVVDEANNGKEALTMIGSIKPALVITQWNSLFDVFLYNSSNRPDRYGLSVPAEVFC